MGLGGHDGDDFIVKGDDGTDEGKKITATVDGGVVCLDVVVGNTDQFPGGANSKNLTPCYSSKKTFDLDTTTSALTGTLADQYTYTGTGKFIGFIMEFNSKSAEVQLLVDSDEVFKITGSDLDNIQGQQTAADNLGIAWEPNKKTLTYYPNFPICFETDVKIKAKETSGSVDRLYYLVSIEKVT